jgi:hypothetical protein
MSGDTLKYDVAISFLSQDQAIAAAFHQKLTESLEVFFFPRNQDDLAGTDGLESMREPFVRGSRVIVVLYRERWGKTPWTRVEETAIKDGCLEHGWERLFFVVLDRESPLPRWLPQTHVRFNYEDYGLEQAVGAIKARVQENGGRPAPFTPIKRAEMLEAEQQYIRDKSRMNSAEGLDKILDSVRDMFDEIQSQCTNINQQQSLRIRCSATFAKGQVVQPCAMTDDHVGLTVSWFQRFSNTLDGSALVVTEFNGRLILPNETGQMYFMKPEVLGERKYAPDLSLAREYGWKEEGISDFISSHMLAERCVIRFLDLVSRRNRGELPTRQLR